MPRLIEGYFEKEQKLLDILYADWPVGEERRLNQADITDTINLASISKAMRHFESLGIFTKRLVFGQVNTPDMGRHFYYTLLMSKDEAQKVLALSTDERRKGSYENYAHGGKKSGDVRRGKPQSAKQANHELLMSTAAVLATNDKEEVRAIAGDEPISSLATRLKEARRTAAVPDESAALVEAARQYAGRSGAIKDKIKELEEIATQLGMTIDTSQMLGAVSFEPDPVLETVALALPYITSLENRIAHQGETIAEQRTKLEGYDALKTANRRLSEQNQRLIGEKIQIGATH